MKIIKDIDSRLKVYPLSRFPQGEKLSSPLGEGREGGKKYFVCRISLKVFWIYVYYSITIDFCYYENYPLSFSPPWGKHARFGGGWDGGYFNKRERVILTRR